MAALSDLDLKRVLNDDEGIIILRRREKSFTGLGYDLTIGFICDIDTGKIPATFADEDNVERYKLIAGHRYLVISKEFIHLSSLYMATLHSRGSYAIKGLLVMSTTVDPNYTGCITGALFNCSISDIYIKKENQFATMVFYELITPTNTFLQINERGNPMDTQETFHGRYPNMHADAISAGDAYYGRVRKIVEPEFIDSLKRMYQKLKNNEKMNKKEQTYEEKGPRTIITTFLIGNGFDLNAGLDTGYRNFYGYYVGKYSNTSLAKAMQKDMDKWSDLELELGQYTNAIAPQEKEIFWDEEEHLESVLVEYLQKEIKRIHLNDKEIRNKIASEMYRFLTEFYKRNQKESIESIKSVLEDGNNLKKYAYITFNYTYTLEECLETLAERYPYPNERENVLHIHGELDDGSIVLGVNDENQIANPNFRDTDSKDRLVKTNINESYENNRVKEAHNLIDHSDIIGIFGMSFGKTDQMWWRIIVEWLQEDTHRELVLFSKKEGDFRVQKKRLQEERKIREEFFNNGNIPEEMRHSVERQIHVIINADLFQFRLV